MVNLCLQPPTVNPSGFQERRLLISLGFFPLVFSLFFFFHLLRFLSSLLIFSYLSVILVDRIMPYPHCVPDSLYVYYPVALVYALYTSVDDA